VKGEVHFSHVFELSHEQWTKGELSSDEKQPGALTESYLEKAKVVATTGKVHTSNSKISEFFISHLPLNCSW
jgi:hypothetical protein